MTARLPTGVGVGARGLGEVEQLTAGLVLEGAQTGAEALEDLAEASEAGPRRGVGRQRGPERCEVAQHDVVDR